jgi:HK97 family phage portal protein
MNRRTALSKAFQWLTKSTFGLMGVTGSRGWWPLIHELSTGGWQRNESISIDSVLSNPTLYACVTLIAGDIAKLYPCLVEKDEDGIWNEIESPAFSPVLRKPNHYQTRVDFFEWWMLSKLVHGNTYALKARDGRGVVQRLYILDPYRVMPLVAPDGSVFYQLSEDRLNQVAPEDAIVVPAREIIHDVMCPLFHPLCGVSPIYAAGFPAMQGLNIRSTSDKFFTGGSKPGGVLTAPGAISPETAQRLKEYWDTNFSGDNIGKIAVLGDGLKYEAMAVTAEQSQLIEQLRMTDEDICKCFHMPRHKVGVGPDPTFNNAEVLNQMYYSDCLQKLIEKLELKLDEGLELVNVPGRTLGVQFDLDDLIRMDMGAKSEAAVKAIGSGMSYNEARFKFYDLGPKTGGDSPLAQQQYYSIEALAKRDAMQGAPPTPQNALNPAPDQATEEPAPAEDKAIEAVHALFAFQAKALQMDLECPRV